MHRKYLALCFYPLLLSAITTSLSAKGSVDCRVATGDIQMCNPYASKFVIAKEVEYQKDKKKLIVSKTLPVPKKAKVKVISVIDMIEKYVKVAKPIRYEGSAERELETLKIESPADSNAKSLAQELEERRMASIRKLEKIQEESYLKCTKISLPTPSTLPEKEKIEIVKPRAVYIVKKGETLKSLAKKFSLTKEKLLSENPLAEGEKLHAGQEVILPMTQEKSDIISTALYTVKSGDILGRIAMDFNLSSSDIIKYNNLKESGMICVGKKLTLPFAHKKPALEKAYKKRLVKERKASRKMRMIRGYGNRKLRVTATAYSSHRNQTDSTPFLAAWNNHIRPGMKIIAVSRDMLTKYGLRNGSKVRIGGLRGLYTVRDKMNKRYRKRIDIYMGTNRRRALRWGRRSVVIYF